MASFNTMIFDVTGSALSLRERVQVPTSGSLQAEHCCFYFNSDWDSFGGKLAFFGADRDDLVPVLLTEAADTQDNIYYYCNIPRSVLIKNVGKVYIRVQGSDPADSSTLVSTFYRVDIDISGETELYITEEETQAFLADVSARLAFMESKAIANVTINAQNELVLTMEDGTVFNLGNVRGSDGVSVTDVSVSRSDGHLRITTSDGVVHDLGDTIGRDGNGLKSAEVIDGYLWITQTYGQHFSAGYVKGDKGDKGDTGAQGAKGDKGDKGDTGATGAAGNDGADGADGADGKSAYEVAVDNGFSGTEAQWLASLVGATGPAGSDAKQISSIGITAQGYLQVTFNDNSTYSTALVNLKPTLPTGAGGSDVRYSLQELATFLYNTKQNTIIKPLPEIAYTYTTISQVADDTTNLPDGWYIVEQGWTLDLDGENSKSIADGNIIAIKRTTLTCEIMIYGIAGGEIRYSNSRHTAAFGRYANSANIYVKNEVNSMLAQKQNTLTFDNTPTAGSNNPVTSGGVYTAQASKQDVCVELTTGQSQTQTQTVTQWLQGFYDELTGATAIVSDIEGVIG